MRIEWNIRKKRGNFRPVLSYAVSLEEHEKSLALPPLSVVSSIPKPEEARQEYCYPGQFERGAKGEDASLECYALDVPSHQGHSWTQTLRLPWRADNVYPEVEASFLVLREAFEKEMAAAYDSQPMREEGGLGLSDRVRSSVAPEVLARRFLRVAQKSMGQAG